MSILLAESSAEQHLCEHPDGAVVGRDERRQAQVGEVGRQGAQGRGGGQRGAGARVQVRSLAKD